MDNSAVRIKICGIQDAATAHATALAGADAIGMVFVPGSRQVTPEVAREICQALPPFITKVGVFMDTPPEEIRQVVKYCGLDAVQLHGSEGPQYCRELGLNCIKTFSLGDGNSLTRVNDYPVKAVLFDTYVPGLKGGTGRVFDWHLLNKLQLKVPFILAGGLTPENVGRAIVLVNPYGVDVSSGVERDGRKNILLIREFINRVRGLANATG